MIVKVRTFRELVRGDTDEVKGSDLPCQAELYKWKPPKVRSIFHTVANMTVVYVE